MSQQLDPRSEQPVDQDLRLGANGHHHITRWTRQGVFLALGGISLVVLGPKIVELLSEAPRLLTIRPRWYVVMIVLELISFTCAWWLTKIVLPKVSWFVAASSQVVSNAVSRIVPGGAATGGATLYRMLSVSGVSSGEAGAALAATSAISTGALFAIPAAGLLLALLGAPIPESLWPAGVAGLVLFVLLVTIGAIGLRYTRPLLRVGLMVDRVVRTATARREKPKRVDPRRLVAERDRLVEALGSNWPKAIVAAAGNWAFDYLTLIAALYSVGADPRLSLVLLAYAGGAVLTMIPFTPGGFGFVETGLTSLLVISGISLQNALLATLVYRIVSFWLPVLAGAVAWIPFKRRYHTPILGGTDK